MTPSPMTPAPRHRQSGIALVGALGALAIVAIVTPFLVQLMRDSLDRLAADAAAGQMDRVSAAAQQFLKERWSMIVDAAGADTAAQFTVADLQAEGLLAEGFSPTNVWGQRYEINVVEPEANHLLLLVLTRGGRGGPGADAAFAAQTVPGAAARIGAKGGFVPLGRRPSREPATVQGTGGGWSFDLTELTNVDTPGPGHLAAIGYFDDRGLVSDHLNRFEIPGEAEANTMHTKVLMDDHELGGEGEQGAKALNLADHERSAFTCNDGGRVFFDASEGLYVCRDDADHVVWSSANAIGLQQATIAADGDTVDKPDCPDTADDLRPAIFVSAMNAAEGPEAKAMAAFQEWADDLGDRWRVHLRVRTEDGWSRPDAPRGLVQVLTVCAASA